MIYMKALFLIWSILTISQLSNGQLTLTLNPSPACNSTPSFKVGDLCQYTLTVTVPANNSTDLYIELFTSDSTTSFVQLCKPQIRFDNGISSTIQDIEMVSDYLSKSQFDRSTIDFGTVTATSTGSIYVDFNVVMINNGQTSSSQAWISAGAEYFSQSEVWIGQNSMSYVTSTEPGTPLSTATISPSTANIEVGKSGIFDYTIAASSLRYFQLKATAISSSPDVSVCSIHIRSADWCYNCLNSVKTNVLSNLDSNQLLTLDLGYVANIGSNTNNVSASSIVFTVQYRVLSTAKIGSTYTITITVTANSTATLPSIMVGTISIIPISQLVETTAPLPTITASLNKTTVNIYEPFVLSIVADFPFNYNNLLQLDVVGNTSDGSPRMKICSWNASVTGENMPCPNCLDSTNTDFYSAYVPTVAFDRMTWQTYIKNQQIRTPIESPTANRIQFDVHGQLIPNVANTQNTNISIIASLTCGNQSLWVGEVIFTVGVMSNFSNASDVLSFNISYADTYGSSAQDSYLTRLVFFDIYTKPTDQVFQPLTVEVVMPETYVGNNIPAATLCKAEIVYVGKYASCVQSHVINNPKNNMVAYQSRMVRFKNDKGLINLGGVCNSANTQTNDADGLIRILLYIQLEEDSTAVANNYISVGVQYTSTKIFIGQIMLAKNIPSGSPPTLGTPYSYTQNATAVDISAGRYGIIELVFKVPPLTRSSYSIELSLSTATLTSGYVSLCTFKISAQGANVPCSNPIMHNYKYDPISLTRNYDYAYIGTLCSINNITATVNSTANFDDDSVTIEAITFASRDASGPHTLTATIYDSGNNQSVATTSKTWTASPSTNITDVASSTIMNSTIEAIDPNSNLIPPSTTNTFYVGQLIIIRYNISLFQKKSFELSLSLNTNMPNDQFEIKKFFISNIGDNLPCTKSKLLPPIFTNGTLYPYAATLNVGGLCYYPIDELNATANILSVEAHIRIPINTAITTGSSVTISVNANIDGTSTAFLSQSLTGTVAIATSPLSGQSTSINMTVTPIDMSYVGVRSTVSLTADLFIPFYTSVQTSLSLKLLSPFQFGNFLSAKITHVGRNVDNFYSEIQSPSVYSNITAFYKDTVFFDFGIVTNSLYTYKIDDYDPVLDDKITIDCTFLITDNALAIDNATVTLETSATFGINTYLQNINYQIQRTGSEKPILNLNATVLNPAASYLANSNLNVTFHLQHDNASLAEAYNASVKFFLPPYVSFVTGSVLCSSNVITTYLNSMLAFTFPNGILYFGQVIDCIYTVTVDPSSNYANTVKAYGLSVSKVNIYYQSFCEKFYRSLPVADIPNTIYTNPYLSLQYVPETVFIPVKSESSLLPNIQTCQITASVNSGSAASVLSTGWQSDYRSINWYQSGSSYIKIEFVNPTTVTKIALSQIPQTASTATFSRFVISFSDDDMSYAFLPPVTYPITLLASFYNYSLVNEITCNYLRIHIVNVQNSTELQTKVTGFILNNIYGYVNSTSSPRTVCAAATTPSSYYSARSVLYNSLNDTVFVCDGKDTSSQGCFKSSYTAPTTWTELPNTVSNVALWIRDLELLKEYLYGIGSDKVTYLRSDDNGDSWKAVSQLNLVIYNADTLNTGKYKFAKYVTIPTASSASKSVPLAGSPFWNVDTSGVCSAAKPCELDWFD